MECSICKEEINNPFSNDPDGDDLMAFSHNAEPINGGRCCGTCNSTFVIPHRIRLQFESECG